MANWITVKGRHINLDDPHNPVTGDGSFSDLRKDDNSSKGDIRTRAISMFTKDPEERAELERRRKEAQAKNDNQSKPSHQPQQRQEQPKQVVKRNVAHEETEHKKQQLEIIKKNNPMTDDIHTGIRTTKDIYTLNEAMKNSIEEDGEVSSYPDVTKKMINDAIKSGNIVVYSSKPFKQGGFVSPSRMMAQDYAGRSGKVYSQRVKISDIAWINTDEGQIARV